MFFLKSIKTGPDFVPVRQSLSFIWFLSLRTFSVIVDLRGFVSHLAFCWSNLFQPLASLCLRSFVLSIFSLLFHLTFSWGSSVAPPPFYPRPPHFPDCPSFLQTVHTAVRWEGASGQGELTCVWVSPWFLSIWLAHEDIKMPLGSSYPRKSLPVLVQTWRLSSERQASAKLTSPEKVSLCVGFCSFGLLCILDDLLKYVIF